VQGPAAHGRDVAQADIEGFPAEEPRRVERPAEINPLDQEVLGEEQFFGTADDGGVVTDPQPDACPPATAQPTPDFRDDAPFAEVFQP
jgi:hypothetical protein